MTLKQIIDEGLDASQTLMQVAELQKVAAEMDVVEKITDNSLDFDSKMKILEKEYAPIDDTYEMKVQAHKRGIKWGKFFDSIL